MSADTEIQELADRIRELLDSDEHEEALELLQDATAPKLRALKIEALVEAEEFEEAEDEWDDLGLDVDEPGKDPHPWTVRGFLLYHVDDADNAKDAFDIAIKLDGKQVRAILGRALVLNEMEYDRAAHIDLDRALIVLEGKEDSHSSILRAETYSLKASFALQEDDFEAAETHLKAAHTSNPEDAEYPLELARLTSLHGRVEEAIGYAKTASELDELLLEAHLLHSQLLGLDGKLDEAVQAAKNALELDDEEPYSFLQLASALTLAGDAEGALKAAEKAIELDPDLVDGYQLRHGAQQILELPVIATPELQEKLAAAPDLPDFLYGDQFDPYEHAKGALEGMAQMSPDQLKGLADEMFSMLNLPPALRPMVESMMENLPAMMQQYPELASGQIPPELMSNLGGMMPPMGAMAGVPTEAPAERPPLQVIEGGKSDEDA